VTPCRLVDSKISEKRTVLHCLMPPKLHDFQHHPDDLKHTKRFISSSGRKRQCWHLQKTKFSKGKQCNSDCNKHPIPFTAGLLVRFIKPAT